MTLTPERLKDGLDAALRGEPPHAPLATDLAAGRRRLRRQRTLQLAAGSVALVTVLGATYGLVSGNSPQTARDLGGLTASAPPSDDVAALVEACRHGENTPEAIRQMFGAGAPTAAAVAQGPEQARLALLALDGAHWANCYVDLTGEAEFSASMEVWSTTGTSTDLLSTVSMCQEAECDEYSGTWVDRLPPEVARVDFTLADGTVQRVPTTDGFVAVVYQGKLRKPVTKDGPDDYAIESGLIRVDYVAADGTVLAAQAMDGTGAGEDGERIAGLPLLKEYPSLRGAQTY